MPGRLEETITKIVSDRFAGLSEPYQYLTPTTWSDRPSNFADPALDPTDVPDNPDKAYFIWGFSIWGSSTVPSDLIAP